jgi:tetratricopeptide (TPR) repeat protein
MIRNANPAGRRLHGSAWKTAGAALVILGITILAGASVISDVIAGWMLGRFPISGDVDAYQALTHVSHYLTFFVVPVALIFVMSGVVSLVRSSRFHAICANSVLQNDSRPPVLYLRSFGSDPLSQVGGWEEQFVSVLKDIGPVIALGKPEEKLPPLGAARHYAGDTDWQELILDWFSKAALVVLRIGETEGVWWELEQALRFVQPERLLLLVPAKRDEYKKFRDQVRLIARQDLPEFDSGLPGLTAPSRKWTMQSSFWLVCFKPDWTPMLLGSKGGRTPNFSVGLMGKMLTFERDLRRAIRPIFHHLNVPEKPSMVRVKWVMPSFVGLFVFFLWIVFLTSRALQKPNVDQELHLALNSPRGATTQLALLWHACEAESDTTWDSVIRGCTAIIESNREPNRAALAFFYRGFAYDKQKRWKLALADYSQAIRLDPKNAKAINNRANLYQEQGNLEEALADFNTAISLAPLDALPLSNRGTLYLGQRQYDLAILDFTKAIGIDKSDATAFFNRGWAYDQLGQHDRAIGDYTQSILLDSTQADAFVNRGVAYLAKRQYDHAIADLDHAIRLNPTNAPAFSARCSAHGLTRQLDAALADCSESLRLRPKDSHTIGARGSIYLRLGQLDKAIDDYDAALQLDPRDSRALYGRGVARHRKGDARGATIDIAAAEAITPDIAQGFAEFRVKP